MEVGGESMAIDVAIVSPLTTEAILGFNFLREGPDRHIPRAAL